MQYIFRTFVKNTFYYDSAFRKRASKMGSNP